MASGYDYTVREGSLDGPVVGTYHHDESNDLAAPRKSDIIRLKGLMGKWHGLPGIPL